MPYKSEKQRRLMHAKHPGIAARWDKEYGTKVSKTVYPMMSVRAVKNTNPGKKIPKLRPVARALMGSVSVGKSAWGVVTKLDQADVHVVSTMTGPKKARRRKLKRIVET